MKKIYFIVFAITAFASGAFAQTDDLLGNNFKRCATAELLENFQRANPGAETTAQFEAWIQAKIQERRANPLMRQISPGVTIPVVFHIIHDGEALNTGRNIPQTAIIQQVLQLNKDFANRSGSPYAVSEDMGIQFALAQNDPSGIPLAEPGIDRIDRNSKGWVAIGTGYTVGYASPAANYLTNTIKPNSIWDPNRYLNIWVSQWEATILGIATFPSSSGLSGLNNAETDQTAGVTISYTTAGSIFAPSGAQGCAGPYGKGKTLTHELGHFFGLRHIWGDGVCATDYCNDTPTHQGQNNGDPQHPKPNGCGTPDEMFENFMDYVNDLTQNTFTVNQGDRMEAVWANSPRRASLATSNAGLVMPTGSSSIAFADCDGFLTVNEASGMTACPKFKDLSITVNVEDRATSATTVNIVTGGTAVNGVDYVLNTPGLAFATGDQSKPISLRIIDDGVGTGNKTIVLSYTITGTGLTAGTTGQTLTINLIDDDIIRTVNHTNPTTVLYSENFGTAPNNGNAPAGWLNAAISGSTNLFTVNANYGTATGFSAADGRMLHVTNGTGPEKMAETAGNTYNMGVTGNPVAMTPSISTVGYKNIKFNFDYASFGELIGSTLFDVGRLRYSITSQGSVSVLTNSAGNQYFFYNTPGKTASSITMAPAFENIPNLWLGFEWINANTSGGTNPPFTIDNIVVTGDALQVESSVSTASANSQRAGQTAQYTTSGNRIIATIGSPDVNINCLAAAITSAGTSRAVLNTNTGSYLRSDKVISLTPGTAAPAATYQATFYYTTAELAAWGVDVPNLKILKVADGVNLSSTLNSANAALFTPIVTDLRATAGYVSFRINATGGFSQFLLVSPFTTLPVSLISFEARPVGKKIVLNWSTATEINNKGFVIERSKDGANFETIGWMDGAVNSNRQTNYAYSDNFVQPNQLYYYRLRQTDLNASESLSAIRQARIGENAALQVTISPNPAKGQVKIFVYGTNNVSTVNLVNAKGQLVKKWSRLNFAAAPQTLDISRFAAGVYTLQVITPDNILSEKLVIE